MKTLWYRFQHFLWLRGVNLPASWWPEPPEQFDGWEDG